MSTRWVRLTRLQVAGSSLAVLLGVAIVILWVFTHQEDARHGAMHMLLGGLGLTFGFGGILAADAWDRRKRNL